MSANLTQRILSHRFDQRAGSAIPLSREQRTLVAIVSGNIKDGSYQMLAEDCPCGNSGCDRLVSEVDRYGLPIDTVLCSVCGTLRTNPYPDDNSLADFYTRYYQQMYARSEDRPAYFKKQQIYGQRVLDSVSAWLPEGAFVFEAGCGAGGALDVIRHGGYQVGGCDYSQELVDYGGSNGLSLHWGPPLAVLKSLDSPSLIYMHHVFEHVRDPLAQLRGLREFLAPGGKILIIVPDVSSIGEYPFPAGDLRLFLHIAHHYNFSLEGFRMLAARAGLTVESLQKRNAHSSPEFWALLSIQPDVADVKVDLYAGRNMLAYLNRTERLRSFYLTRGQFINLPAYVLGKLRRLLGRIRRLLSSTQIGAL